MSSAENPYQSPRTDGEAWLHDPDAATRQADFRNVFLAWERMRIFFNLILAFPSGGYVISRAASGGLGWDHIVFFTQCAIVANIGFCVMPVFEGYLTWFTGKNMRVFRTLLFPAITLVALFFGAVALIDFVRWRRLEEDMAPLTYAPKWNTHIQHNSIQSIQ